MILNMLAKQSSVRRSNSAVTLVLSRWNSLNRIRYDGGKSRESCGFDGWLWAMVSSSSGRCNLILWGLLGGKSTGAIRREGSIQLSTAQRQALECIITETEEFIPKTWKHWWWRLIKMPSIHHSVSTSNATRALESCSFPSTFWIFPSFPEQTFQESADAVVKWYCSKCFCWEQHLSFQMDEGPCSPCGVWFLISVSRQWCKLTRLQRTIYLCLQHGSREPLKGQTEGSSGNNDAEQIMTQHNIVAWKWLSYHQGYHMSGNIVTAIWKTSTPPSEGTYFTRMSCSTWAWLRLLDVLRSSAYVNAPISRFIDLTLAAHLFQDWF